MIVHPDTGSIDTLLVKHTPCPWYPSRGNGAVCSIHPSRDTKSVSTDAGEIRYYGGYLLCESVEKKADVAVMAAAPDMYTLLFKLHEWLAISATGRQAFAFQREIQQLFYEIWRMENIK